MIEKQLIATSMGPIAIEQVELTELDVVLDILEEAAHWQASRGIDQWRPGCFKRGPFQSSIADRIEQGVVYLAFQGEQVLGTITLQWNDPVDAKLWKQARNREDAGYIHRLAIRRCYAGLGVGRCLLQWAEQTMLDLSKHFARLDCMAENEALCAYYERAGYICQGEVQDNGWGARLYEKQLLDSSSSYFEKKG